MRFAYLDEIEHHVLATLARNASHALRPTEIANVLRLNDLSHDDDLTSMVGVRVDKLVRTGQAVPQPHNRFMITQAGCAAMIEAGIASSVIANPIQHPGSMALNLSTGEVAIGIKAVGGLEDWQLWNRQGGVHGFVLGSSGTGKTVLTEGLVEATVNTDVIKTWLIDPNSQFDQRRMNDGSRVATDEGETISMLDKVLSVINSRNETFARKNQGKWTGPTRQFPLGLLLVSQLPLVLENNAVRDRLAIVLRMARKVGISVVCESYTMSISAFRHNAAIRDAVIAGNALILRNVIPMEQTLTEKMLDAKHVNIPREQNNGDPTAGIGYNRSREILRVFMTR